MAYTKTNWENGVTPVNATNLNHIEQGIYDNSVGIGNLSNLETTEKTNMVGALNEVRTNFGGTLLWTNSNPTSTFDSQTLSNVDFSNYDMVEILFYQAANQLILCSTGILKITTGRLFTHFNGSLWDRDFSFSNNNISFGTGNKYATYGNNTRTTNNAACIPVYIIGYKTGLFS